MLAALLGSAVVARSSYGGYGRRASNYGDYAAPQRQSYGGYQPQQQYESRSYNDSPYKGLSRRGPRGYGKSSRGRGYGRSGVKDLGGLRDTKDIKDLGRIRGLRQSRGTRDLRGLRDTKDIRDLGNQRGSY